MPALRHRIFQKMVIKAIGGKAETEKTFMEIKRKTEDMGRNKRKERDSGRFSNPTNGAGGILNERQKVVAGGPFQTKVLEIGLQPNSGKIRETSRPFCSSADPPPKKPKVSKGSPSQLSKAREVMVGRGKKILEMSHKEVP
jgi:hypothetical protein